MHGQRLPSLALRAARGGAEPCLSGGAKGLFGVTKTDTSFAFFELLRPRGASTTAAEAPADDYRALLAICKAPAFDGALRRGRLGGPVLQNCSVV